MACSRISPREISFLAVFSSLKGEGYAKDSLDRWLKEQQPSMKDYRLAQEIAYGTIKMAAALDYLAKKISSKNKLSLKLKEKALLRTALYQYYYMDQIPLYAIGNESGALAKKYCHPYFEKFLNAIVRSIVKYPFELPEGNSVAELAIRYSYPEFFVSDLLKSYGIEAAKEILQVGNDKAPLMYRIRERDGLGMAQLLNFELFKQIAESPRYYIQNITPAFLIWNLCLQIPHKPKRILDLCSSPGGKLLAAHDFMGNEALLHGNDISEYKLKKLAENCKKYSIKAILSSSPGEYYRSHEKFDLVIVDAPCSNSGVLNKRPEARWRLSDEQELQLKVIQKALLKRASELTTKDGEIWYMTCSFLKNENEEIARWAAENLNLKVVYQETIVPNRQGWDGGFACRLAAQTK